MKKIFTLIILLLFIFSCKEKKVNETTNLNPGELNQSCLKDNSCNDGLICSTKNICINGLDECKKISCSNHGTCIVEDNKLACDCDEGYYSNGYFCKSNNLCKDVTCSNHGQCIVEENIAKCNCDENYYSLNLFCISNDDPCKDVVCSNIGKCEISNGVPKCNCEDGFYSNGLNCINESQFCIGIDCSNHGNCVVDENIASCKCFLGYSGNECETNINDCEENPCLNDGRCTDKVAGYECSCKTGYSGLNCEINIDDCEENPCLNGSFCIDGVNSYSCDCRVGYKGNLCNRCDDGFVMEDNKCVIKLSTMEKDIKVEMPFKDYTQYSVVGEDPIRLNEDGEARVSLYPIFSNLYIIDENENIVAIYYGLLDNNIKVTTETTALGAVLSIPIDWKKYQESLDNIITLIKENNNFVLLKERINNIAISKPEALFDDNYVQDLIVTIINEVRGDLTEISPPSWFEILSAPYISSNESDGCEYIKITNILSIPYGISLYDITNEKMTSYFLPERKRPMSILGTSNLKTLKDKIGEEGLDIYNNLLEKYSYIPTTDIGNNKINYRLGDGEYFICFGKMYDGIDYQNIIREKLGGNYNPYTMKNNILNLSPLEITKLTSRIKGTTSFFTSQLISSIIDKIFGNITNDDFINSLIGEIFFRIVDFISENNYEHIKNIINGDLINIILNILNDFKENATYYSTIMGIKEVEFKAFITMDIMAIKILLSEFNSYYELAGMVLDQAFSESTSCYHLQTIRNENSCYVQKEKIENNCDNIECIDIEECREGVCVLKENRCLWNSHCQEGEQCKRETHTCETDPCKNISYDNHYQHCKNGIIKTNEGLCANNSDCDNDDICNVSHFCVTPSNCNNVTCSYKGRCFIENNQAKCNCYNGYHADELNCIVNGECTSCQQENRECGILNDNCGNELNCGSCNNGFSCINGSCISNCTSHNHKGCFNDDIYWYNSCNEKEELATDCINHEVCHNNQNIFECSDSCTPQEQEKESCNITNGIGEKARFCNADGISWSNWSSCNVKSCNNGYIEQDDSCVPQLCTPRERDTQSCNIINGDGEKVRFCSSDGSSWGNWSNCNVTNCNNGYSESNNECIEVCNPNLDPLYGGNDAPSSYCACYDNIYLTLNNDSSLSIDGSYCSIDQGDIYQIQGDGFLNYDWTVYLADGTGRLDVDIKCKGTSIGSSAIVTNNSCSNTDYGAALCSIENSQVLSFTYNSNICPQGMNQFIWIKITNASPSYRIIIREGN